MSKPLPNVPDWNQPLPIDWRWILLSFHPWRRYCFERARRRRRVSFGPMAVADVYDPNELLLGFVKWCAEADDPWFDGQEVAERARNLLAAYERLAEVKRMRSTVGLNASEHPLGREPF